MVFGAVLLVAGMAWLTQISAGSSYASGILGPMLLFGLGAGCSFMPVTMTVLAGVQRHDSGAASGLLQTMQQVGGALGVSILVTIFGTASRDAAKHPLAHATPQLQAHQIMAHGIASAFVASTVFAACTLAIALLVITRTPSRRAAGSPAAGTLSTRDADLAPAALAQERRGA